MQESRNESTRIEPPLSVSGGKRLNFSRLDPYGDDLMEDFIGSGKCDGTYPSCSWEELCAMAKLIVDHPAFRLPEHTDPYNPPRIEEADRA